MVNLGTRVDSFFKLKNSFRYPDAKPNKPFNDHGFFEKNHEDFFLPRIKSCSIILELGTYYGKSLRFFLKNSEAYTIAVDVFDDDMYNQFVSNQWDYRDRIVLMRMYSNKAIETIHSFGVSPDLVYVDADHCHESVISDINLCVKLFSPSTFICGDDYNWATVKRGVEEYCTNNGKNYAVDPSMGLWYLTD